MWYVAYLLRSEASVNVYRDCGGLLGGRDTLW
jgi:hypothetical protein